MAEATATADSMPCPGCHRLRPTGITQCPHCGLPLAGKLAAQLRQIDDELHGLAAAMSYPANSAQAHFGATPEQLTRRYRELLTERGNTLSELYAEPRPVATDSSTAAYYPPPHSGASPANLWVPADMRAGGPAETAAGPETSPRFVQNTLLILGGILLSAAAIGFTAVAWNDLGLTARTVVLGAVTLLVLTVPLLLARRGLRATAETAVMVWILLLILDAIAVRRADLIGPMLGGFFYSAIVGTIVVVITVGYGMLSRLSAPKLAAIVIGHGVPPLFALGISATALSFAVACAVIVAADVAIVVVAGVAGRHSHPAEPSVPGGNEAAKVALGKGAWLLCVLGGTVAAIAAATAALAEITVRESAARTIGAGAVIAAVAALGALSGALTRGATWPSAAAALAPLVIWVDATALVLRLSSEFSLALTIAAAVGLVITVSAVLQPQRLRAGATIGAGVALGITAVPLAVWVLLAAAGPPAGKSSDWSQISDVGDRMLCGVALVCVGWALLQWRWHPRGAGVETAVGPALVAVAAFTTVIGPISGAPTALLVALPLCGAAMITGLGLLDTGITREGTFAAGFVLAASAGLRGLSGAESMSVTLGLLCLMYAAIALTTASGGVRVTSTTVSCAAWLGVAASLTATADGGEILAAYLLLIAVIVLIAIAAVLDTFGERSISPVSVAMEGMAGVGGFFAFMLALQSALDSALLITTFCALLAAMSLRESRRPAVWWALGLSVIAVALWLRAAHVETVEGYTIPIAMVLLIVGVIAYQRRPSQTSWVTFGPALLIGVTPSLGLVLFAKADPLRALLLGTAALGIMTIGTFTGRQAPFVLGAVAVAVVAVRMVTPLLPRLSADLPVWVPLAGAGVLLVIVGASYERGRRDMRRLVGVIRRMD